jgi:hypothetical protein
MQGQGEPLLLVAQTRVEDGDGKVHPGKFVGETESASWLGGVPRAHVVHAETDQAEVVAIFRVTPRDE